jgi:23S rRNA (guanosine2251-2'-O)-methyltransferase
MAGTAGRRGAVRREASKKGPTVGSGGQKRQGLAGKGPTPKASERTGHPAARRATGSARTSSASATARKGPPAAARKAAAARRPGGDGPEFVAGRNPVVEALRAGVPVKAIYVASRIEPDARVREALKAASEKRLPLLEVSKTDLDRMTNGAVHQGLVAQVPAYRYARLGDLLDGAAASRRPALIVVLDGVTDPRNLGAVVRSVAAFGGHGVIVPERRAAGMTASAWKTSAGAASRVPVARVTNLTRALEDLQRAGCFVAGLDAGGSLDLPALEAATDPLVLVVGSEGKGLSRLVRATCDVVVSIPMAAGTESLNAGVAAGVALYEVARRRMGA